jgi:hypothetical protein
VIEALKDHLMSVNHLLSRKDDEYNRLLTQHETLLLERWVHIGEEGIVIYQHESQRSK